MNSSADTVLACLPNLSAARKDSQTQFPPVAIYLNQVAGQCVIGWFPLADSARIPLDERGEGGNVILFDHSCATAGMHLMADMCFGTSGNILALKRAALMPPRYSRGKYNYGIIVRFLHL